MPCGRDPLVLKEALRALNVEAGSCATKRRVSAVRTARPYVRSWRRSRGSGSRAWCASWSRSKARDDDILT
jgi:hypothetical protein